MFCSLGSSPDLSSITYILLCDHLGVMVCICRATTRPPRSSSTAECLRLIAHPKRGTGIYGLLGTSATILGGRDGLTSCSAGLESLGQSVPGYFGCRVGRSQSEAFPPFSVGNANVQTSMTSQWL